MNLEVDRGDLRHLRVREGAGSALNDGEALLRVDAFALTSNNITYAVFGDALRYWEFFPAAAGDDGTRWGRIPVWGFADVVESRCAGVAVGDRYYGYYPMSTHLGVVPGKVGERGFTDMAPHRAPMAGAYNSYRRVSTDPIYRPEWEAHQMLLFPLFFTSFLIDDLLGDNELFGAEQVVVSSASSKTSIGVAFLAHARRGPRVVGLTSPGNAAFAAGLGVYDEVVTYDRAGHLADVPSVYVDVAGDRDVQWAVHTRLGDRLRSSLTVGATHWDHRPAAEAELPGPQPHFFFAPAQIAKRTQEWGSDGLDARIAEAWDRFVTWCDSWLRFERSEGAAAVEAAYRSLLDGRGDPAVGSVCSLHARAERAS